jgi:hypothetical protein
VTNLAWGPEPKHLAIDTAYGMGKFLSSLIGTGITPHIPVWDMSATCRLLTRGLLSSRC